MNSLHDVGGIHGFGPVDTTDEAMYHHQWERRILGLRQALSALGKWSLDISRHSNERLPARIYLAASYFERWVLSTDTVLLEHGLATKKEIETCRADGPATESLPVLRAKGVAKRFRTGKSSRVDADVSPKYRIGDAVVARNITPTGHTRLPRYARGKRGRINSDHGVFVFPDTNAASRDPKPQHLYSVRFSSTELWGADFPRNDQVCIDLWDDYLDPA